MRQFTMLDGWTATAVIALILTLMQWQTSKFPNWHYLPFQRKSSAHVVLSCADAGCTWKRLHLSPWWHSRSIWHQAYEHLSPLWHLSPADHINTASIQTNDTPSHATSSWGTYNKNSVAPSSFTSLCAWNASCWKYAELRRTLLWFTLLQKNK
jgi:hypothetical protein